MAPVLLLLPQSGTPGDCILTGLCNVVTEAGPAVAPGVMYIATGLVLVGAIGWRRVRRAPSVPPPAAS